MYGRPSCFALPILSTTYADAHVPTCATPTPEGLVFTFEENRLGITGKLTVVTDGTDITAVEIGGPDLDDQLEVGDWGFPHLRIERASTATIAGDGIDEETLDTLRSLIYSAIGYAQGHAAPIIARLTPPPATVRAAPPCPCACNSGGWCGGCGHAGCGGR